MIEDDYWDLFPSGSRRYSSPCLSVPMSLMPILQIMTQFPIWLRNLFLVNRAMRTSLLCLLLANQRRNSFFIFHGCTWKGSLELFSPDPHWGSSFLLFAALLWLLTLSKSQWDWMNPGALPLLKSQELRFSGQSKTVGGVPSVFISSAPSKCCWVMEAELASEAFAVDPSLIHR